MTDFCDGRGLGEARRQPACYKWMLDGTRLMKGGEYVEAVKIRLGLVETKERSTRGRARNLDEISCDLGCRRNETLDHILQEYPHTSQHRVLKHNAVNQALKSELDRKGFASILEPTIATVVSIRRPDIVCWRRDQAYVIDTTICADAHATRMKAVYQLKVNYYSTENIASWVRVTSGCGQVCTEALVMNWRGDTAPRTHRFLKSLDMLGIKLLELTTWRVLFEYSASSNRRQGTGDDCLNPEQELM